MSIFEFRLIERHCTCEGCAHKITKRIKTLQGVESAKVQRTQDENGDYVVSFIIKGNFDPEKIIHGVEIVTKKRIELVSDRKVNQIYPIEAKYPSAPIADFSKGKHKESSDYNKIIVIPRKKLKKIASNNLEKSRKLKEMLNECENLKAQLNNARARQHMLASLKQDIFNRFPTEPLPQMSQGRKPKKKEESQLLYEKLARQEIKVENFVDKYKRLQIKKQKQFFTT